MSSTYKVYARLPKYSEVENIEPVGCVIGSGGNRINRILKQLAHEKIDVILYDKEMAVSRLKELLLKISRKEISKIVILYKDRLVRFGYEMIEYLCQINDVEIEVIDQTEYSREQELTDDLIQIITVFANRLYGQRSKKTKKLMLCKPISPLSIF